MINSVSNFLTKSLFLKYIKDVRGRLQGNLVLMSLIDSVLAFGFDALKSSRQFASPDEKKKADSYSRMALSSYGGVLRSTNTLLKLQVRLPFYY
jgi:hypothetical protein